MSKSYQCPVQFNMFDCIVTGLKLVWIFKEIKSCLFLFIYTNVKNKRSKLIERPGYSKVVNNVTFRRFLAKDAASSANINMGRYKVDISIAKT